MLGSRGKARIPIFGGRSLAVPVILGSMASKEAKSGVYEIGITQFNPNGEVSGAAAVQLTVGKKG